MECRKCLSKDLVLFTGGLHIGLYCKCGEWVKWVSKKELPLLKKLYGEVLRDE